MRAAGYRKRHIDVSSDVERLSPLRKEVLSSMRVVWIGAVVSLIGVMGLGVVGHARAVEPLQSSVGTRQRLVLAPDQREMILAEMRLMLGSIHGIVRGLATGDRSAMEQAARASGVEESADVDPHIRTLLPRQFLELGMRTHRRFDGLADRIQAGSSHADIIRELAKLTGHCVACHAMYRLDEAR